MGAFGELSYLSEEEYYDFLEEKKRQFSVNKKPKDFASGKLEKDMIWLEKPVVFDNFRHQAEHYFSWVKEMYDNRQRYMAKCWKFKGKRKVLNEETGKEEIIEAEFFKQVMVQYEELLKIASKTNNVDDQYLSPNVFSFPTTRRSDTLREYQAVFSDLDFYKLHITKQEALDFIDKLIEEKKIPRYNVKIISRGFQLVWLHEPVPFYRGADWKRFQDYLYNQLKDLKSDEQAKDTSRVLRASGSLHSATGEKILMEIHSFDRFVFDEIFHRYVPFATPTKDKTRKKYKKPLKADEVVSNRFWAKLAWGSDAQLRSLHIARYKDLENIVKIRNYDVYGHRELLCFLYLLFYLRAHGNVSQARRAMLDFYSSFNRVPGDEYSDLSLQFATMSAIKDWEEWVENHETARYNFKNEWIIDKLNIIPEEQKKLLTIIGSKEYQRRNTEYQTSKRRKKGVKPREEYEEERKANKEHLLDMLKRQLERNPKAKRKDLAELLGVTGPRITQLKKELEKR